MIFFSTEDMEAIGKQVKKLNALFTLITSLIELAIAVAYLRSVIALETAAILGLGVALLFFAQRIWRNRKTLKNQEAQQKLQKFPAIAQFLGIMKSLPEEMQKDDSVLYKTVEVNYDITGSDGIYTRREVGQNVSDEKLEKHLYRLGGETSIVENGRLQCNVSVRNSNGETEELEPNVVWSSPTVKVIGVLLNPAVRPKVGALDIEYSATWPGAFVSKHGYVAASLLHCNRGVDNLSINVAFEKPVSNCSVWTFDTTNNELAELEKLNKPRRRNNKFTIRWQRPRPDIEKIYIVRYRRSDIN